jgi:YVTN family beta-propeller protein
MQLNRHLLFIALLLTRGMAVTSAQRVQRTVTDPGVITTRQTITPAGVQAIFGGQVFAVGFCGSDSTVSIAAQEDTATIYRLNLGTNQGLMRNSFGGQVLGIQGMSCLPGNAATLVSLSREGEAKPDQRLVLLSDGQQRDFSGGLAKGAIGGLGVSRGGTRGVVALTGSNEVAILDLKERRITQRVQAGIAPFTAVINREGTVAWTSNWGGRVPKHNQRIIGRTAPTGPDVAADRVTIDARGIAATGTVSRIDLAERKVTHELDVGLHPTALAWDEERNRLYVANSNDDSISVVDTETNRLTSTWSIQPFTDRVRGIAPTSLVLAPDGQTLYIACGGINAVAIMNVRDASVRGLIPTGWYPSHLALTAGGRTLAVATLLGVGSGTHLSDSNLKFLREGLTGLRPRIDRRYVHSYRGTVHIVELPDENQLAAYSKAVAENNHLQLGPPLHPSLAIRDQKVKVSPVPVPTRSSDRSLIDHVVYIVKENRTYDQLFGDLERGNGDPSLTLYGEEVTPNHRKLAREFVLLDNFYATGGNSGDGHQWVTQSAESDYTLLSGYVGRSYPFDGNDPIAYASGGFLWDLALRRGKTFADFGEFIPEGQFPERQRTPRVGNAEIRAELMKEWRTGSDFMNRFQVASPIPPLDAHLIRDFPSYGGESPDVVRARIFRRHLKEWENSGRMPNLIYVQLPSDHTGGTKPGYSTPKACLADNDLALGQIIEGLTHSRFWSRMAIFVVEDDAQGGVDHVDGHRTVALVISPYIRRRSIDSTFYSHPSIARTIELMLGLPNLSLFDLIANDMRNSFSTTADFTPYTAIEPKQSLFEVNPSVQTLKGQARRDAVASARMNWSVPDAAPAQRLNRILWRNERGPKARYPSVRRAAFIPYQMADADDNQ